MWREIIEVIRQHQHFLVTTHVNPDGDGIGAACALIELLRLQGKNVKLIYDSPIPEKFHFLDFHGTFNNFDPNADYAEVEVLIILDTYRRERIGRVAKLLDRKNVISLCIDHHRPSDTSVDHMAIDPNACAVGTMVYTLFKSSGYPLNQRAATGIYTSILCDTGRFCHATTSRKAHKIADECIRLGVFPETIYRQIFQQVSFNEMQMISQALSSMEQHLDSRVVFITLESDKHPQLSELDLEYLHEFIKLLKPVDCIAVFRDLGNGKIRISLRSKGEYDVQTVAKTLGGGGHAQAAGATCDGPIAKLKSQVRTLLYQFLYQSV